jgi:RimJ/RimL family protein N-acetyltransferase
VEFHREDRFVIRHVRTEDVDAFVENRNDPTTAEFQSWTLPYPVDKGEKLISELVSLGRPTDGEWFSFAIADPITDRLIGDVAIHLESGGRAAMLGYNVSSAYRRQGIAFSATTWVVEYLFNDLEVKRIHASLHPENFASMTLLEKLGFVYEGTARQAYWVGDTCTDDPKFGLLRSDWTAWKRRPRQRPNNVELALITPANRNVFGLVTHHSQERFVAPMGKSASDALIADVDDNGGTIVPWFRAVVADDEVVGFVMVAEPTATNPHPFLWRLLVDRMHQRRGIGRAVLDGLVDRYRSAGYDRLLVSWVPGIGSPEPMYLAYGFVPTGEMEDDEIVASYDLSGDLVRAATRQAD